VLSEDRYDLIVNEPSNPWISGVSNLFTEEFLKLGRSRLTESGVFVQWTQIYGMGPDDLRMLLRTFRSVFPHVLVASTIEYADIILVGSAAPLALDVASTARMFTTPRIRDDLARVDVHAPADLIATLLLDEPGVREAAREGDLNTDDNLRIEFSAPNFLHTRTADTNALLLYDAAAPPERLLDALSVPLSDKAAQLAALADAYSAAGHHLRGIIAWEQLALLVPSDPRPRQRIPELRRRHAEAEEQ
jgi:spermidine synthase